MGRKIESKSIKSVKELKRQEKIILETKDASGRIHSNESLIRYIEHTRITVRYHVIPIKKGKK